jgi:hypothetical protein
MADGLGISTNTYGSSNEKLQNFFGDKKVPTKIVEEVDRLAKAGNAPAVSTIENSEYVKRMKDQLPPDKYKSFLNDFQSEYQTKMLQRIDSPFYKNKPVDKKKDLLEKDKADTLDKILRKYHYKKPSNVVEIRK